MIRWIMDRYLKPNLNEKELKATILNKYLNNMHKGTT